MQAHFFDIDTLISSDAKVWIVDKHRPKECLIKVRPSDFNLIRNGVYRNQGNKVSFAGHDYYLPDDIMNRLKLNAKVKKADVSNLAFSMREFQDPELIESSRHSVDVDAVVHLKNTQDDVYIICSRNIKTAYSSVIKRLEEKLSDLGISPKNYYFISETFYERDEDETSFDKVRLLIQHLVGSKSEGRKFVEEKVAAYERIYFYDEDDSSTQLATKASDLLGVMLENTADDVSKSIRESLKSKAPELVVNTVTNNRVSKFVSKSVKLENSKLIKTFESFRFLR